MTGTRARDPPPRSAVAPAAPATRLSREPLPLHRLHGRKVDLEHVEVLHEVGSAGARTNPGPAPMITYWVIPSRTAASSACSRITGPDQHARGWTAAESRRSQRVTRSTRRGGVVTRRRRGPAAQRGERRGLPRGGRDRAGAWARAAATSSAVVARVFIACPSPSRSSRSRGRSAACGGAGRAPGPPPTG